MTSCGKSFQSLWRSDGNVHICVRYNCVGIITDGKTTTFLIYEQTIERKCHWRIPFFPSYFHILNAVCGAGRVQSESTSRKSGSLPQHHHFYGNGMTFLGNLGHWYSCLAASNITTGFKTAYKFMVNLQWYTGQIYICWHDIIFSIWVNDSFGLFLNSSPF